MAPPGSVRRWDLQQIHGINTKCRGVWCWQEMPKTPDLGHRGTELGLHPAKVLLQPGLGQGPSVPGCHRGCQGHCSLHPSSAQLSSCLGSAPALGRAGSQSCPARVLLGALLHAMRSQAHVMLSP